MALSPEQVEGVREYIRKQHEVDEAKRALHARQAELKNIARSKISGGLALAHKLYYHGPAVVTVDGETYRIAAEDPNTYVLELESLAVID